MMRFVLVAGCLVAVVMCAALVGRELKVHVTVMPLIIAAFCLVCGVVWAVQPLLSGIQSEGLRHVATGAACLVAVPFLGYLTLVLWILSWSLFGGSVK